MQPQNNNTVAYRVGQLEKRQEAMDVKIDSILTNHFPSLDKKMEALDTRVKTMTAINVGAIIIGIILNKAL